MNASWPRGGGPGSRLNRIADVVVMGPGSAGGGPAEWSFRDSQELPRSRSSDRRSGCRGLPRLRGRSTRSHLPIFTARPGNGAVGMKPSALQALERLRSSCGRWSPAHGTEVAADGVVDGPPVDTLRSSPELDFHGGPRPGGTNGEAEAVGQVERIPAPGFALGGFSAADRAAVNFECRSHRPGGGRYCRYFVRRTSESGGTRRRADGRRRNPEGHAGAMILARPSDDCGGHSRFSESPCQPVVIDPEWVCEVFSDRPAALADRAACRCASIPTCCGTSWISRVPYRRSE